MRNFIETFGNRKVASVLAILGLSGGTEYTLSDTVQKGADGQEYVIPANAHRPVHSNKQDCEADLKAHAAQIKEETGGDVDPSTACVPITNYKPALYPHSYYYGPMTSSQGWNRKMSWYGHEPLTDNLLPRVKRRSMMS